jgi:hypothetical protein
MKGLGVEMISRATGCFLACVLLMVSAISEAATDAAGDLGAQLDAISKNCVLLGVNAHIMGDPASWDRFSSCKKNASIAGKSAYSDFVRKRPELKSLAVDTYASWTAYLELIDPDNDLDSADAQADFVKSATRLRLELP